MEDAKKALPSLSSVHEVEEEVCCNPQAEYFFYYKCQLALKKFSRVKYSFSDTRMLTPKTLYRVLEHIGFRSQYSKGMSSVWRMKSFALCSLAHPGWDPSVKNQATLNWLVLRNVLWVGKNLCCEVSSYAKVNALSMGWWIPWYTSSFLEAS